METRLKSFTHFLIEREQASDHLLYHIENGLSIVESVFRPGSQAHLSLLSETREFFDKGVIKLTNKIEESLFATTELGLFGEYEGVEVPLDFVFEAKGEKTPKLNYPRRNTAGKKKYYVYVRKPDTGNVVKIQFGDIHGGLTAKVSNPAARKSFAARHNCKDKKDKTKAGYWACRINRYAHLWGGKTYPGFW